jgi:uncharacterized protein YciI
MNDIGRCAPGLYGALGRLPMTLVARQPAPHGSWRRTAQPVLTGRADDAAEWSIAHVSCAPPMPEWIDLLHPPRENFAATMTDEEREVWGVHFQRLKRLLDEGTMIAVGPTLGPVDTGVAIFEAPDEDAARTIVEEDPVVSGGFARGELRAFRLALLRGRDEG